MRKPLLTPLWILFAIFLGGYYVIPDQANLWSLLSIIKLLCALCSIVTLFSILPVSKK